MSKIQLADSVMDIVVKMSEGNPGAINAIMELLKKSAEIDPQSALGGVGPVLSLDTHGIYGSAIYIIWNDKCGKDTRKMCMLLRAVQFGLLPEAKLKEMAADQMREVDLTEEEWSDLDTKVCAELAEFQKKAA